MKLVTVYGSPTPPGRLAAALTAAEKYEKRPPAETQMPARVVPVRHLLIL